jgi:8-oxo-dGTP diphosphatase
MADRDGNGWVRCAQGHRHWGRYGAAGLLAYAPGDGGVTVLLQRRSRWSHHPGTWGPPGGARDSHESAVAAALREAVEEVELPASQVGVAGILRDDHGGWSYQTVIAAASERFAVRSASAETCDAGWVPEHEVATLDLHPGFAGQWPELRASLIPLTVIVDVANVMGARADGWWRDRAGAAARLHGELVSLAGRGVRGLPDSLPGPALERWFPAFVLVLEGAARAALRDIAARPGGSAGVPPDEFAGVLPGRPPQAAQGGSRAAARGLSPDSRVQVVAASGSGDDLIAGLAARPGGHRLVVTADRELRSRCTAAGAAVTGPRWLLGML